MRNYYYNNVFLGGVKRLTYLIGILFIASAYFVLLPVLLASANGQGPSSSSAIAVGSKFQILVEYEVKYQESPYFQSETYFRQSEVGEVQIFEDDGSMGPSPGHPRLLIKGFGHGTHEFRKSSSNCGYDVSGPFNVIFLGFIGDDGTGNTLVQPSAYPVSTADISKTIESADLAKIMNNKYAAQEYIATTTVICDGKEVVGTSMPGVVGSLTNLTKLYLKEGSINEEEIIQMPEHSGYVRNKVVLSPPALKYDILGTVKGIAKVKGSNPISNSKVVMIDAEELKKKFGNTYSPSTPLKLSDLQLPFEQKTTTSDDKNAKYSFTIDGKGKVFPTMLVVSLLWYDKEKGGGGEFAVTTGPEKAGKKIPIYLVSCVSNLYPGECHPWKPNKAKDGFEAEVNFVYGDNSLHSLFYLVTNEDLYPRTPFRGTLAGDAAYIYYNSYRAMKYFESLKGKVSMTLNPVTIDIYDTVQEGCHNATTNTDIDNAFYSSAQSPNIGGLGTKLEPVKSTGAMVVICNLDSGRKYPDAPDMREYHELGHYLQKAMYLPDVPFKLNGKYHAGYENPDTNDSVVEGFASFVTLLINEHYKVGTTKTQSTYRLGDTRIDVKDYKVWGDHVKLVRDANGKIKVIDVNYNGPPDQEERAVTGILWDIHDKVQDRRSQLSTLYKTSIDMLSLPDWQILKIISDNHPMNLVQLHDNFAANLPQDKVDMIFINHGAFADNLIRNLVQEVPAELPGFTGDTRTDPVNRVNRMKEPLVPGSYVVAQNDATFNISMIHDPPYSDSDFSYLDNMTKGKLTYFEMSPSYYPSKTVFDQVSADGNKTLAAKVLVIDSDEYWNYIESNPSEKQVFKTVPVPVAVPSFPVEQVNNLNMTGLNRGNGTFNENSNLTSNTQQSNISPSINQNNSSLNPSFSSYPPPSTPTPTPRPINNAVSTSTSPVSPQERTISENSTSPPVPLPSSNGTLTAGTSSQNSNGTYVTIQLLAGSSPLFFKCNETSVNGESTLPGLNVTASATQAITDGNPNTQILGNVTFDLNFEKPFIDRPGTDLIIYGVGVESVGIKYINGTETESDFPSNWYGLPMGISDDCGNPKSAFQLDLEMLSIPAGSSITGLRINNDPHKNGGAHISDITTFIN